MSIDILALAEASLAASTIEAKLQRSESAFTAITADGFTFNDALPPRAITQPGRPPRPRLVEPRALPQRGLGSSEGRAALMHAVAHIEFNAINLAWDAVYRFRGMPADYYRDWVAVAADEARHFRLLPHAWPSSATTTAISMRTTACGKWR